MIWVRSYKPKKFTGVWEYHIKFTRPDGTEVEERKRSPFPTDKQKTERYAKRREAELLEQALRPRKAALAPTLGEWWPRYEAIRTAARDKPSTLAWRRSCFNKWLLPVLADVRIADITVAHVNAIKEAMIERSPKSVNHTLDGLRACLRTAVEAGAIAAMPCRVAGVRAIKPDVSFYSAPELEALLNASGDAAHVAVLLGAHAGLRSGEILALRWSDVDFQTGKLTVARSIWQGHEGTPKSGKSRVIPMSARLAAALKEHRHLRGERVLYCADGRPVDGDTIRLWVRDAELAGGLAPSARCVHKLRHTFASTLALRGVPGHVIQELCGHHSLTVTQKYLHLAPDSMAAAVSVFDRAAGVAMGDIRETASRKPANG